MSLSLTDDWRLLPIPADLGFIPRPIVEHFPLLSPRHSLHNYLLHHRGISEHSYRWFHIRTIPGDAHTLILPFTNLLGNVIGLSLRNVISGVIRSLAISGWDLPKKGKLGSWFGLAHLVPSSPILIVEGEIDAMKAHTFGFTNVIAAGGAGITKAQGKAIFSNSKVLLGLDSDKTGRNSILGFRKRLRHNIKVSVIDWFPYKDVGEIKDEEEFWKRINAAET